VLGPHFFKMEYLAKFGEDEASLFRFEDIPRAFQEPVAAWQLDDYDIEELKPFESDNTAGIVEDLGELEEWDLLGPLSTGRFRHLTKRQMLLHVMPLTII